MVVTAPAGATANTVDVTHLTARRRTNPDVYDGATDTTTVVSARSHDLAGGGTRVANPGDVANHPGTLVNLNPTTADRFEMAITPASLYGLDGLNHPTGLYVDKDGDGVIGNIASENTAVAIDTDGDGDWDTIDPAYNVAGTGANPLTPDLPVPAGATLAYELRRQVDNNQKIARDFVTLTATSRATSESDSVTGTVLLAAVTRARLGGIRVDPPGRRRVHHAAAAGDARLQPVRDRRELAPRHAPRAPPEPGRLALPRLARPDRVSGRDRPGHAPLPRVRRARGRRRAPPDGSVRGRRREPRARLRPQPRGASSARASPRAPSARCRTAGWVT